MKPLPLLALALGAFAWSTAACDSGGSRTADVRTTSIVPPPGAFDVSRRTDVRVVFTRDVDPASCTAATCRFETLAGAAVATDLAYDAAARQLTMTPQRALEPLATYRVRLLRGLRDASGAAFANESDWTFTTDGAPVWDRAVDVAAGTLLACERARDGGALAVWQTPALFVELAHFDGASWSTPVRLAQSALRGAAVAEDGTGRIVVAMTTTQGTVQVTTGALATPFSAPEAVGFDAISASVAASDSGHVLVAAEGDPSWFRTFVPGTGWTAAYTMPPTVPSAHLDANGVGRVVGGFNTFVPLASSLPWSQRFCVDAAGVVSTCDPAPGVPNSAARRSKVRFAGGGRIVAAHTLEETNGQLNYLVTHVYEWTPALGWQDLPMLLTGNAGGYDVAVGPTAATATATAFLEEGLQPFVTIREEVGFSQPSVGDAAQPAPRNPTCAVVIGDDFRTSMLWTAAVDASPSAPVRLMAWHRSAAGSAATPVEVERAFAAGEVPIELLRAVALGANGALAVWSRDGAVRCSTLR